LNEENQRPANYPAGAQQWASDFWRALFERVLAASGIAVVLCYAMAFISERAFAALTGTLYVPLPDTIPMIVRGALVVMMGTSLYWFVTHFIGALPAIRRWRRKQRLRRAAAYGKWFLRYRKRGLGGAVAAAQLWGAVNEVSFYLFALVVAAAFLTAISVARIQTELRGCAGCISVITDKGSATGVRLRTEGDRLFLLAPDRTIKVIQWDDVQAISNLH
jgi:hypothetical protein